MFTKMHSHGSIFSNAVVTSRPSYQTMLTKFKFLCLPAICVLQLSAQPATEVYLFDISKKGENRILSNKINVSANPGFYDNQPSFSKDGKTLYYVSADGNGQIDIYEFDTKTGARINFSRTSAASEYSPTLTPDGNFISCIRVVGEEQLLWKFPIGGGEPEIVVPDLVIGYHAWLNADTLVSFVLGEPHTLRVSSLPAGKNTIAAENIGRSIHLIPGTKLFSFLQNRENQPALIQSLDPSNGTIQTIAEALPDSQDMIWTQDGEILMGQGNALYAWSKSKPEWTKVAELPDNLQGITRLATSRDGKKIAIVISE